MDAIHPPLGARDLAPSENLLCTPQKLGDQLIIIRGSAPFPEAPVCDEVIWTDGTFMVKPWWARAAEL
jgi:hypothetical protein